jgi:hypothetical protein
LYHAILLSPLLADNTSTRPSRSTSAACTHTAPAADVEIVYDVQVIGEPTAFLCHAILLSNMLADSTSTLPSSSTSTAYTDLALSAVAVMT